MQQAAEHPRDEKEMTIQSLSGEVLCTLSSCALTEEDLKNDVQQAGQLFLEQNLDGFFRNMLTWLTARKTEKEDGTQIVQSITTMR